MILFETPITIGFYILTVFTVLAIAKTRLRASRASRS